MENLPADFLIYQSEKNKRKEKKRDDTASTSTSSSSSSDKHSKSESKSDVHCLLDSVIGLLKQSNTNLNPFEIIARDMNELKLLQSHREAIKSHSASLANQMTSSVQKTSPPPPPITVIPPPTTPPTPPTPIPMPVPIPPSKIRRKLLLFSNSKK
jgi:hypothetical protein